MSAIIDLELLLRSMSPQLQDTSYVFCRVDGTVAEHLSLDPLATFREDEGLTLVLEQRRALEAGLGFEGVFRMITLSVHSSLNAVGLTAAVSSRLAERDISANVIAAYYHDHIFVPHHQAEAALAALEQLSDDSD
ncbi:ACT domain-containing protein [Motiliproteus coralliicola]|uniref:ACT domain-containing protein n=1 Tax=Motiliproteus coralliicola TaxID=2283196 RepID=A0A369WW07_9GAMM|nr:ACT domain-containing protein [Motiliproteus coralliicola]RDE25219.1 ACT domain-containing protein [Motiliproteus coralliicola]